MGANGSHANGTLESTEGRKYYTLFSMGDNIVVLGQKDSSRSGKLPEESHSPNRIYVSFWADGKGVKEISQYDSDCKKIYAIHTAEHTDKKSKVKLAPHYHTWEKGKPSKEAYPLTQKMKTLLSKIENYEE